MQEPTAQEPTAQEPTAQEPTAQEPTAQEPTAQAASPPWKLYHKVTKGMEARPYVQGEDMTGVTVNSGHTPREGGFIMRNPDDPADQWYLTPEYFAENYREV